MENSNLGYIFTHLPRARNVNLFDPIHLQYYQHLKNCVKPHEIKGLVVTYGWSSFPRYQLAQYYEPSINDVTHFWGFLTPPSHHALPLVAYFTKHGRSSPPSPQADDVIYGWPLCARRKNKSDPFDCPSGMSTIH